MQNKFDQELETRLVRYTAIDSQSDGASTSTPSTEIQFDMLNLLQQELAEIGAEDIELTEYGAVLATIPGNVEGPTIGFLAHVDTAPQFNATGVKPRVIKKYNGGDITFPDDPELVLSPNDYPYLAKKVGHDLVTASGTTLLGADDKAGISIIMTMARHLLEDKDAKRVPIRIAFTVDEEIGRGVTRQLPKDLKADFAYTLDGAEIGDVEYETFSADFASIKIEGVSIHPGWAKGQLVNTTHLASKIVQTLPQATMTPETTEGREGFIFITSMSGDAAAMEIQLIIRDFELDDLAARGEMVKQVCAAVQATEPRAKISCEIRQQYRNMRYWLEKDMTPVDLVYDACRGMGIEPVSVPFRAGTDGSLMTEYGTSTPNIFTGMQNVHGPLEWISVQDMAVSTELCLSIVSRAAKS